MQLLKLSSIVFKVLAYVGRDGRTNVRTDRHVTTKSFRSMGSVIEFLWCFYSQSDYLIKDHTQCIWNVCPSHMTRELSLTQLLYTLVKETFSKVRQPFQLHVVLFLGRYIFFWFILQLSVRDCSNMIFALLCIYFHFHLFSINHKKDKQKNNNNAIHYKFIIT